jgi:hypothetical protein
MSDDPSAPDLMIFARWLAAKAPERSIAECATRRPSASLVAAARRARDESRRLAEDVGTGHEQLTPGTGEVLQLLAAADASAVLPPPLTTASGFRVTLANELGGQPGAATLCVLVRCPTGLIESIEGRIACLCRGAERFELGQFDSEGKAIGTLPAAVDLVLSDFSRGNIRLEVLPQGCAE